MTKTKAKNTKRRDNITNDHLSELQRLVGSANNTSMTIGTLETRKFEMLQKMDVINKELMKFEAVLQENYGTNNIDVTNGKIIYDEQAN
tara:strand:- start:1869 stop:2135 length:267 start_codon:yes stop_codon:yes gene_type:complete